MKVCFSDVVRSVSETRNGEFKLYRMTKKQLEKFNPNAIKMFKNVMERNYQIFLDNKNLFSSKTNIKVFNESTFDLENHHELLKSVDLVITSPPYGDSHTTVAYGQFSRLANEWLGFKDAGQLDRNLLGGEKNIRPLFWNCRIR